VTTPIKSIETKPTNAKAIDLDELFGNTKTAETTNYEAPKETIVAPIQTEQKTQNDHHLLQKIVF